MEGLELKHLVPYLPHEVNSRDSTNTIYRLDLYLDTATRFLSGEFKMILRPLSDLKKDDNTNLYLDLCDELGTNNIDNLLLALENENYYALDIQKYHILEEWMFKNHFDWKFGLIKKGLAIDINTL